ncbi:PUA domain-containing protein [Methanomassiliicoccus luminyensis]|jgi:PUA domain protein|uniref:PUA domain-containing protein n=1 Tax=Methanomassiliicoccus luminyensis TaxID=1080712 RepID=UPI000360A824|nr:PUA domain-containing protein [Methanomassiliicoccus luminyensis]
MSEIRIRKRHRLREKEIKVLDDEIRERLGAEAFSPGEAVDRAESSEYDVLFIGNQVQGIVYQGKAFLTVRGLLKHPATKAWVTVDMGAVPFVTKGADVMGPGIVDADPALKAGDLVWIRDIKNGRPLAIGEALVPGSELGTKVPGKAIKSIHYVADKLWKLDEE